MEDFGLYVIITNPVLTYGRIAEICVGNGTGMLQLREKGLSDRALLSAAREIKEITRGTKTLFVVNDRADIAVLARADVLHLGQGDLTLSDARRLTGPDMKIGISTHSPEQAKEAIAQGADYIGFGPVYKTPAKAVPDPVTGIEQLAEVVAFSPVPVVAIGGIFPDNLDKILAAGAKNVCLVRYLMESPELDTRIKYLNSKMECF